MWDSGVRGGPGVREGQWGGGGVRGHRGGEEGVKAGALHAAKEAPGRGHARRPCGRVESGGRQSGGRGFKSRPAHRGLKRMSTVGSWDVKVTSREAFSIMYAAPFCSPAAQAKAVQMSEREAAGAGGVSVLGRAGGGMGEG